MRNDNHGNPLMIIPLLGVLAYLDYAANGGRTIAAAMGMVQAAQAIDVAAVRGHLSSVVGLVIIGGAVVVLFRNRASLGTMHATTPAHSRSAGRMPGGMPRRLTATVADVLSVRGGADAQGQPLFWLDGKGSTVTP